MAFIKAVISVKQLRLCVALLSAATLLSTAGIIGSGRLASPTTELKKYSEGSTLNFDYRLNSREHHRLQTLESGMNHTLLPTSVDFRSASIHPDRSTNEVNVSRRMSTSSPHSTTNGPAPPRTSVDINSTSIHLNSSTDLNASHQTPVTPLLTNESTLRCNQQNCLDKDKLSKSVNFNSTTIHPNSPTTKLNASHQTPVSSPPSTDTKTPQCKQQNCLEFLSSADKQKHTKCLGETRKYFKHDTVIQQSSCTFLLDGSRRPVALASPEGSGNTWLRGLLEKATGVCTGFCCCDPEMRVLGFPGEGITGGNVLVVKTHIDTPQWLGGKKKLQWEGSYGSAVLLIRNPARALIAEWNRRVTNLLKSKRHKRKSIAITDPLDSHTFAVSEDEFKNERWRTFSEDYLKQWIARLNNWVFKNDKHPVHVVAYEDLKNNTVREVEKILDFLQFRYTHQDLVQKLRVDFTNFQRAHVDDGFQHFSPEQKEQLNQTLHTVIHTARESGKEPLFHFNDYLESLHDVI